MTLARNVMALGQNNAGTSRSNESILGDHPTWFQRTQCVPKSLVSDGLIYHGERRRVNQTAALIWY